MTTPRCIQLRGAEENNLRQVDVDVPLHRLTVVCGVSGSGKTSLALDTLYAEGQRRYIESFSAYTRQFLARIEKPKFASLEHLPPSIAIARGGRSRNNRSTVGTASELMEPMRILFSQIASLGCHGCGKPVRAHTPASVQRFLESLASGRGLLGFEFAWTSKADLSQRLYDFQSSGLIRILIDDQLLDLSGDRSQWAKTVRSRGQGAVIVERFRVGEANLDAHRLQSLELAFEQAEGCILVLVEKTALDRGTLGDAASLVPVEASDATKETILAGVPYVAFRFSKDLRCGGCGTEFLPAEPRLFNFNSPIGACPECTGFGEVASLDWNKILPDRTLSLREGAIAPWRTPSYCHELEELVALASDYHIPLDVPVSQLTQKHWSLVQGGVSERSFGGLDGFFSWLERKKYKMHVRAFLARWRSYQPCPKCNGARLSPAALAYRFEGQHFWQLCERSIGDLRSLVQQQLLSETPSIAVDPKALASAIDSVASRLQYLDAVGLGYLTLDRTMHTLSGGEAQRVQLTTLLGSDLVDMLYVLDEPTVGLHPNDTKKVAEAIERLVTRGNTVLLIEHEPYLLFRADHVLEVGPGAGASGGNICFSGSPATWKQADTLTSRYLFAKEQPRREPRGIGARFLTLTGATGRNLRGDAFRIPLHCLTTVIGVSGSGKSSLVLDTLVPAIQKALGAESEEGLPFEGLDGVQGLHACVAMDQSPIAKSIRSTPVTYLKAMDEIRAAFAALPEARASGLSASHFSFNSSAGRCPVCEGLGFTVVDMQFMADVRLTCSQCNGARYQHQVLTVRYRDRNIAEVLQLSVVEAKDFFRGATKLQQRLQPLIDIGLGYLPLGQCVSSLSAGESMRLKLASHLEEKNHALIVMDEPTTGLHFADVERLLHCIDVLIERGNTVLVIEHNEQMIRASDYWVELGPGAGPEGGRVVASGVRTGHDFPGAAR